MLGLKNLRLNNCLLWHKWNTWSEPTLYKVHDILFNYDGYVTVQTRICVHCGKMQVQELRQ